MVATMNKPKTEVPLEMMLTYLELQVLQLLVQGNSISEISEILNLKKIRIESIAIFLFARFEVDNIASLIDEAIRQGVVWIK